MLQKIVSIAQDHLGDLLDRLIMIGLGFGLGVKVIVINHQIDPGQIELKLLAADWILLAAAPLAAVLLTRTIRWGKGQTQQ